MTTTLRLWENGTPVGHSDLPAGQFSIGSSPATYKLTLDVDQTANQGNSGDGWAPVSPRSSTAWTFHSAAPPSESDLVPVPLLLLDYQLPLDLTNHPTSDQATFTIHPQNNTPAQTISQFTLATSTNDGTTWQQAPSHPLNGGRFQATLPTVAPGTWVSLRVDARSTTGNRVQQTIIRAYRAALS